MSFILHDAPEHLRKAFKVYRVLPSPGLTLSLSVVLTFALCLKMHLFQTLHLTETKNILNISALTLKNSDIICKRSFTLSYT